MRSSALRRLAAAALGWLLVAPWARAGTVQVDVSFDGLNARRLAGVPLFLLRDVSGFSWRNIPGVTDGRRDRTTSDPVR